jgi:hypothetical protein
VVIDTNFSTNFGGSFDVNDVSFLMSNAPTDRKNAASVVPNEITFDSTPISFDSGYDGSAYDGGEPYDAGEPWDGGDADRETNASIQNIVEKLNETYFLLSFLFLFLIILVVFRLNTYLQYILNPQTN